MRAVLVLDVPDAFMQGRAADLSSELGEQVTAEEHFAACVREVAEDALPLAFFGWPAGVSIAFPCPTCHGMKCVDDARGLGVPCLTCEGSGDRPGTEELTPA